MNFVLAFFLAKGTRLLRLGCYLLAGVRLRSRFLLGALFCMVTQPETVLALILQLVPAWVRSRVVTCAMARESLKCRVHIAPMDQVHSYTENGICGPGPWLHRNRYLWTRSLATPESESVDQVLSISGIQSRVNK